MSPYTKPAFWYSTFERAVKTTAQTAVATIGTNATIYDLSTSEIVGVSVAAGVISVLTSVASAQIGDHGSPSAITGGN